MAVPAEVNKETVRNGIEEIWNKKNIEHEYEIGDPDVVIHAPHTNEPIHGSDGFIDLIKTIQAAFPDYRITIHNMVAEGEWVVARFQWTGTHLGPLMDLPPTGKTVTMEEVNVYRMTPEGKVAELWAHQNMMEMMRQLGLVPDGPPPKAMLLAMRLSERLKALRPGRGG